MPATQRIHVELPRDVADVMRAQVATGRYASESEAVTEALRGAHDENDAIDTWLKTVVAPICESVEAGTAILLTTEEVRERLRRNR